MRSFGLALPNIDLVRGLMRYPKYNVSRYYYAPEAPERLKGLTLLASQRELHGDIFPIHTLTLNPSLVPMVLENGYTGRFFKDKPSFNFFDERIRLDMLKIAIQEQREEMQDLYWLDWHLGNFPQDANAIFNLFPLTDITLNILWILQKYENDLDSMMERAIVRIDKIILMCAVIETTAYHSLGYDPERDWTLFYDRIGVIEEELETNMIGMDLEERFALLKNFAEERTDRLFWSTLLTLAEQISRSQGLPLVGSALAWVLRSLKPNYLYPFELCNLVMAYGKDSFSFDVLESIPEHLRGIYGPLPSRLQEWHHRSDMFPIWERQVLFNSEGDWWMFVIDAFLDYEKARLPQNALVASKDGEFPAMLVTVEMAKFLMRSPQTASNPNDLRLMVAGWAAMITEDARGDCGDYLKETDHNWLELAQRIAKLPNASPYVERLLIHALNALDLMSLFTPSDVFSLICISHQLKGE